MLYAVAGSLLDVRDQGTFCTCDVCRIAGFPLHNMIKEATSLPCMAGYNPTSKWVRAAQLEEYNNTML